MDYPDAPGNPPWSLVLDEISEAGYRYCELGPLGYVPTNSTLLQSEYAQRGLTPAGGSVF